MLDSKRFRKATLFVQIYTNIMGKKTLPQDAWLKPSGMLYLASLKMAYFEHKSGRLKKSCTFCILLYTN